MDILKSRDNPFIKRYLSLLGSRKHREEEASFVIEGVRLCMEALYADSVEFSCLFVTHLAQEKYDDSVQLLFEKAQHTCIISDELGQRLSDTKTPQGVFAICKWLDKKSELDTIDTRGSYLLLESIQDPGNLGTIVRTADAFGLSGLILSADCCDIYNPKVLRATMGAVFRVPIHIAEDVTQAAMQLRAQGIPLYGAVVGKDAVPITLCSFANGGAVCIGNEGNGLSEKLKSICDQRLTIPMQGEAESLNAAMAAGIIMWEMTRR